MIKEAYCSFETAKLLKEKGFDVPCMSYYDYFKSNVTMYQGYVAEFSGSCTNHNGSENYDVFSRPTHQMAIAWLREEKNLYIEIRVDFSDCAYSMYDAFILNLKSCDRFSVLGYNRYSYNDAVETSLKYCLTKLL